MRQISFQYKQTEVILIVGTMVLEHFDSKFSNEQICLFAIGQNLFKYTFFVAFRKPPPFVCRLIFYVV